MRWPALVPGALCKTPIRVVIYLEGIDEDGAPVEHLTVNAVCNWQDSARTVRTDQEHFVRLSGVALFPGDLCPGVAAINGGEVTVFGERRTILSGSKCRNPDGTVNYTRLELV